MICKHNVKLFCCEDISRIENYGEAIGSSESWHCHHRLETHTSDGERRLVDLTSTELKTLGMYYDRPADELIFLKHDEHNRLHRESKESPNKGKMLSEEHRRKISETMKGKHLKRGPMSEETKRKLSEAIKGRKFGPLSDEARRKISEAHKGKTVSRETRDKMSENRKGKHWKLVDGKRVWY